MVACTIFIQTDFVTFIYSRFCGFTIYWFVRNVLFLKHKQYVIICTNFENDENRFNNISGCCTVHVAHITFSSLCGILHFTSRLVLIPASIADPSPTTKDRTAIIYFLLVLTDNILERWYQQDFLSYRYATILYTMLCPQFCILDGSQKFSVHWLRYDLKYNDRRIRPKISSLYSQLKFW